MGQMDSTPKEVKMKRYLIAGALAALPLVAEAGVGSTYGFGGTTSGVAPSLPSIDWNAQGVIGQLHLLDLIVYGANDELKLSGNVFKTMQRAKVNEDIGGVVQLGGGLVLDAPGFDFDYLAWDVQVKARLGAQTQKGAGFGIYVVPGIGVTNSVTGDPTVCGSGMVQFSAWMNK